jgi:hypothetical protein
MTYYAAIDTNVIVSAMLRAGSTPDEVVQLALRAYYPFGQQRGSH